MRLNLKNTYWGNQGKYQNATDKLQKLIPTSGSVERPRKNRWLEKFRKAVNCYYDLYNNGLCNRANEFRLVFGIASSKYFNGWNFSQELVELTETALNEIIEKACKEQGIDLK
jgi:hypothetical protein